MACIAMAMTTQACLLIASHPRLLQPPAFSSSLPHCSSFPIPLSQRQLQPCQGCNTGLDMLYHPNSAGSLCHSQVFPNSPPPPPWSPLSSLGPLSAHHCPFLHDSITVHSTYAAPLRISLWSPTLRPASQHTPSSSLRSKGNFHVQVWNSSPPLLLELGLVRFHHQ